MKSLFSLFFQSQNSFDGQERDEKVLLVLRRHWFVIFVKFVAYSFLGTVPLGVALAFQGQLIGYHIFDAFLFASCIWYLFLWSSLFYTITMYTLDVWIVTDKRIIDSTQHGFFSRTVSELHITRVQDISVVMAGFAATVLKFGDLHVQTAGTEEHFYFQQIPNPAAVKDAIMRIAEVSSRRE